MLEYNGTILAHCNLYLLGSSNSSTSASQVAETTGVRHHTWLIFVFSVEKGFLPVDQAGLEITDLGKPSTSCCFFLIAVEPEEDAIYTRITILGTAAAVVWVLKRAVEQLQQWLDSSYSGNILNMDSGDIGEVQSSYVKDVHRLLAVMYGFLWITVWQQCGRL
ncbi:hypothetical protein AAY473_003038 [Plecturocebus cupreus]